MPAARAGARVGVNRVGEKDEDGTVLERDKEDGVAPGGVERVVLEE